MTQFGAHIMRVELHTCTHVHVGIKLHTHELIPREPLINRFHKNVYERII